MAMIDTAHRAPFGAVTIFRTSSALLDVATAFRDRQERRATSNALAAWSPNQLEDIGLTIADIEPRSRGWADRVVAWFRASIEAAQTARELSALSPRMLEDVGMTLADVDRIKRTGSRN